MLGPFLFGFFLMWVSQLGLALFGWSRRNAMTVAGGRIHWENARFRDLIFVLRLIAGAALAALAASDYPDEDALVYLAGIFVAFILPALSEVPVVLMKRWSIEPSSRSGSSGSRDSEPKSRRGRDL